MPASDAPFPPGFRWGVATSAYQIEGALQADGRGESIWDRFCATPGHIARNESAALACEHYQRWREDLNLLVDLGVDSYRFSIAWARVQPTGQGAPNLRGLDFYERLVDALLARGIQPLPTLYHWDLPQALQDRGGWLARDTCSRFAEFSAIVADRLGDRVTQWITHNETFEHQVFGHVLGTHAPGLALGLDAFAVVHHLLLSHGLALQALRARLPAGTQIGIAQSLAPARPASASEQDQQAAALLDLLHRRQHLEPLLLGAYPPELAALGMDLSACQEGDLALIGQRLDFLGINYYNPNHVQATPPGSALPLAEAGPPPDYETTEMGWPVMPEAFDAMLVELKQQYGAALPPLVITENGAAMADDARQLAYLDSHLQALQRAIAAGVDLRGYHVWSLLDNFEWAEGYRPRFGLVHVDYASQRRRPKPAFAWYREQIARWRR